MSLKDDKQEGKWWEETAGEGEGDTDLGPTMRINIRLDVKTVGCAYWSECFKDGKLMVKRAFHINFELSK